MKSYKSYEDHLTLGIHFFCIRFIGFCDLPELLLQRRLVQTNLHMRKKAVMRGKTDPLL